MKKIYTLILLISSLAYSTQAQMIGTYTVGGASPDFPDMTTAISSLTSTGVIGPVSFKVRPGTYSGQYTIIGVLGSSATNTVTIESENGNAATTIFDDGGAAITTATNFIFRLDGAQFIRIKNIQLNTNDANTFGIAIDLRNDASNNSISGCVFHGAPSYSTYAESCIISCNQSVIGTNFNSNNIEISNCQFNNGVAALYFEGYNSPTERQDNVRIDNCVFSGQIDRAIHLTKQSNLTVINNTLTPAVATSAHYSMELQDCDGDLKIESNTINKLGYDIVSGIHLTTTGSHPLTTASSIRYFLNNMISGQSGVTSTGYIFAQTQYLDIVHNTVLCHSQNNVNLPALQVISSSDINIKNNILCNQANGFAFDISSTTNLNSDYNNLYTNGTTLAFYNVSPVTDLPALQLLSTDLNSNDNEVNFIGYNDLYLRPSSIQDLALRAPTLPGYLFDISANPRHATLTLQGAVERALLPLLAGTYTVGVGGNFASLNGLSSVLASEGVSGTCYFNLLPGLYSERFELLNIPGLSPNTQIIFNSQTGITSSVQIMNTGDGINNYVAQIDNSPYITFKNLTLNNTNLGGGYHRVFDIRNNSDNLTIDNCLITSEYMPSGSDAIMGSLIFCSQDLLPSNLQNDSITISNCDIEGGYCGIYFHADNGLRASKLSIINNSVIQFKEVGTGIFNYSDVLFERNDILGTSSSSDFTGAYFSRCEENLIVSKNKIANGLISNSFDCNGLVLQDFEKAFYNTAKKSKIVNNMININSHGIVNRGIELNQSGFVDVIHNTVLMRGSSPAPSKGLRLSAATDDSLVVIKNNIFQCTNQGYTFEIPNLTLVSQSDYNNFFTNGSNIGYLVVDVTDLVTQTNTNQNSVSVSTVFLAADDLHLDLMMNTFTNLRSQEILVADDNDSALRSAFRPSMGADEICLVPAIMPIVPTTLTTFCSGSNVTLTASGEDLKWYTYNSPIYTLIASNVSSYSLTNVTKTDSLFITSEAPGCTESNYTKVVTKALGKTIIGNITFNATPVTSATIYLLKVNPGFAMDTVQIINPDGAGNYEFNSLPNGNCAILVKPDASLTNAKNTYFGNTTLWQSAIQISSTCIIDTLLANISILSYATTSGPGAISGTVREGSAFGKVDALGDPIPGVDISLEQNPGGIIINVTTTNAAGQYSFSGVPLGSYTVKADIPGIPYASLQNVVVSASDPIKTDVDYEVDSNEIRAVGVQKYLANPVADKKIHVYPNPAKNKIEVYSGSLLISNAVVTIYSVEGKKVVEQIIESTTYSKSINISDLEKGVYFVEIRNGNELARTKLVVQ